MHSNKQYRPFLATKIGKQIAALVLLVALALSATAQLKGTHLLGDMGLQSGSQPPPSFTPAIALYNYHTSSFVTADGSKIDAPSINMFLLGFGGSFVTNLQFLGAHYGGAVLIGFASNKIEGNLITSSSSLAFTDLYVQPLQLGWTTKRADFTGGYAIYLPTGRYELGADDNAGLGILTNELSAGSTFYFDKEKKWHLSALVSYALNSKKKNTKDNDISVGDILTVEGGLGRTWHKKGKAQHLPMIVHAGIVYYLQYKVSPDKMTIPSISGSAFNLKHKDHI